MVLLMQGGGCGEWSGERVASTAILALFFFFFPYYNSIAHKYILSFMKLNFALIWLATEFRGLLPKFPNIF